MKKIISVITLLLLPVITFGSDSDSTQTLTDNEEIVRTPLNSMFQDHVVHELKCLHCNRKLSHRAMKSFLLADTDKQLFSTDSSPDKDTALIGEEHTTNLCNCIIKNMACRGCGNQNGYHVVRPCQNCMSSNNNGHFWIFHAYTVTCSIRASLDGSTYLRWGNIPPPTEDKSGDNITLKTLACLR